MEYWKINCKKDDWFESSTLVWFVKDTFISESLILVLRLPIGHVKKHSHNATFWWNFQKYYIKIIYTIIDRVSLGLSKQYIVGDSVTCPNGWSWTKWRPLTNSATISTYFTFQLDKLIELHVVWLIWSSCNNKKI